MDADTTRRKFLLGGTLAAAGMAGTGGQGQEKAHERKHAESDFPRDHAGPGGSVGSPTDRGKLVPGRRPANEPPVPIDSPDLPKLQPRIVAGVKEFHLTCQPVKRELLPGMFMNHWSYNGSMPGPTIEVVEGDQVRMVVKNDLPEATTLHLHGLELICNQDGAPFVASNPIPPGETGVYEYTLHQNGTYFYHAHAAMQEAIGMVGLFIIQPKKPFEPVVDQDFGLIMQEFAISPTSNTPDTSSMEFNFLTFNGRCGPYATPLVCKLGNRVRIRIVNFSTADHHPVHLHGHTFWVTGTEGGRIPESAWVPGNNVLIGVAQAREFEFIANNPGDWLMHCHMFHHMMNHMIPGVGPGSRGMAKDGKEDPRYKVPGFPQGTGMHTMPTPEEVNKIEANPKVRGMRPHWYMGVMGLHTIVRVLPPDLYERVVTGKGEVKPGESVPGAKPPMMMEMDH